MKYNKEIDKNLLKVAEWYDLRKAYKLIQDAIHETARKDYLEGQGNIKDAGYTRKLQDIGVFINIVI